MCEDPGSVIEIEGKRFPLYTITDVSGLDRRLAVHEGTIFHQGIAATVHDVSVWQNRLGLDEGTILAMASCLPHKTGEHHFLYNTSTYAMKLVEFGNNGSLRISRLTEMVN